MTLWFGADEVAELWEGSDEVETRWEGSDEVFNAGDSPLAANQSLITVGKWPGVGGILGMARPTMPVTFGSAAPNAIGEFPILAMMWGTNVGFDSIVRVGTTRNTPITDYPTTIMVTVNGTTYMGNRPSSVAQRATAQADYSFGSTNIRSLLGDSDEDVGTTHIFTFNFPQE